MRRGEESPCSFTRNQNLRALLQRPLGKKEMRYHRARGEREKGLPWNREDAACRRRKRVKRLLSPEEEKTFCEMPARERNVPIGRIRKGLRTLPSRSWTVVRGKKKKKKKKKKRKEGHAYSSTVHVGGEKDVTIRRQGKTEEWGCHFRSSLSSRQPAHLRKGKENLICALRRRGGRSHAARARRRARTKQEDQVSPPSWGRKRGGSKGVQSNSNIG